MSGYTRTAAPLRLTAQPAFWLFLSLLVGCFLLVGLEQVSYLAAYPGSWPLPIILLAAPAIPPGLVT